MVRASAHPCSEPGSAPNTSWWRPASTVGRVSLLALALLLLGGFTTASYALAHYLERDARFRIAGSTNIQAAGLTELSRADLMPDRPAHVPDPAETGSFWSDGMIRATGREFNGLMESPCYTRGEMSCLSCHEMHQKAGDPPLTALAIQNRIEGLGIPSS